MRDIVNCHMENTRALALWAIEQDNRARDALDIAEEIFSFATFFPPSEGDRLFLNTLSQWVDQRLTKWRQEERPWCVAWMFTKEKEEELTRFRERLNEKMTELNVPHS